MNSILCWSTWERKTQDTNSIQFQTKVYSFICTSAQCVLVGPHTLLLQCLIFLFRSARARYSAHCADLWLTLEKCELPFDKACTKRWWGPLRSEGWGRQERENRRHETMLCLIKLANTSSIFVTQHATFHLILPTFIHPFDTDSVCPLPKSLKVAKNISQLD